MVSHSRPAEQPLHVAPALPHEVLDSDAYGSHVPLEPPLQHPLGQVLSSHWHVPFVLSQRPFGHGAHFAPAVPHADDDSAPYGRHVLPLQQPEGQELASQTHWPVALSHSVPAGQPLHAIPPTPQEPFDSDAYARHAPVKPPLQQPLGHDIASQTQ
jgi:hypothetical protein